MKKRAIIIELQNRRIFITAGAGFIGKHLLTRLMDEKEVVVYDNFSRGHIEEERFFENKVKMVKEDILDLNHLRQSRAGCDVVFHLAAKWGVHSVTKKPVNTIEINFQHPFKYWQTQARIIYNKWFPEHVRLGFMEYFSQPCC